ncbi:MAG: Sec-independent protein translocase protein TatB [Pseudomonadota bacterium]
MFDMGFTEVMLIGVVALVVIGPERLPGVARTAGKYFGRLKRFVSTVRADVEQELRADELREILSKQQKELDSLKNTINETGQELEEEMSGRDKSTPKHPDFAPETFNPDYDAAETDKSESVSSADAAATPTDAGDASDEKPAGKKTS